MAPEISGQFRHFGPDPADVPADLYMGFPFYDSPRYSKGCHLLTGPEAPRAGDNNLRNAGHSCIITLVDFREDFLYADQNFLFVHNRVNIYYFNFYRKAPCLETGSSWEPSFSTNRPIAMLL
jgi:hypothetical protein